MQQVGLQPLPHLLVYKVLERIYIVTLFILSFHFPFFATLPHWGEEWGRVQALMNPPFQQVGDEISHSQLDPHMKRCLQYITCPRFYYAAAIWDRGLSFTSSLQFETTRIYNV